MFTYLRRTTRFGWYNFWRGGSLSLATVFVLIVTISLMASLLIAQGGVKHLIVQIQDKIDISVYLKSDLTQEEVLKTQEKLSDMPEVQTVIMVSKEDALIEFKEKHKNDPVLLESLEIVGVNPFYGSLNIRATTPDQYAAILTVLNSSAMENVVHKVDYVEKKTVIERLSKFISNVNAFGLFLAIALGVVAILVTFNTIRVAIYDSSKEISIMRLVGASNSFIRGPFIVQGIIAGTIAATISFLILFLVTYFSGDRVESITNGFNLFSWFGARAIGLFFLQLATGIVLGVVSSLVAIRKYLTV
ncbi:MAG: permease-like cell division protein FtsX [Patescibacteria group bacterium]|nr:permease-like cell division protein FtsX [Patescibacteria group bacterium]